MKRKFNFVVYKWNSLLLSVSTLWLASVYFGNSRYFVAVVALLFPVIKLVGLLSNNTPMRVLGLIGMNVIWAVTAYLMFTCFSLHTWQYPAIIAFLGFGISLQERFNE